MWSYVLKNFNIGTWLQKSDLYLVKFCQGAVQKKLAHSISAGYFCRDPQEKVFCQNIIYSFFYIVHYNIENWVWNLVRTRTLVALGCMLSCFSSLESIGFHSWNAMYSIEILLAVYLTPHPDSRASLLSPIRYAAHLNFMLPHAGMQCPAVAWRIWASTICLQMLKYQVFKCTVFLFLPTSPCFQQQFNSS